MGLGKDGGGVGTGKQIETDQELSTQQEKQRDLLNCTYFKFLD